MRSRVATPIVLSLLAISGSGGSAAALRAAAPPLAAQASPGALPFDQLEIFARKDLTTEINLEGALLKLVASAAGEDDPEFARLVSGLESIRVQVAPLTAGDPERVRAKLDQAVHWLESKGWTAVVRTREKGEETYIYTRMVKGEMVGLTVLSFELGKEASVVNIVGRLDPAQLGRIGQGFHVHQLDKISPKDKEKEKDKPRDAKHPG